MCFTEHDSVAHVSTFRMRPPALLQLMMHIPCLTPDSHAIFDVHITIYNSLVLFAYLDSCVNSGKWQTSDVIHRIECFFGFFISFILIKLAKSQNQVWSHMQCMHACAALTPASD